MIASLIKEKQTNNVLKMQTECEYSYIEINQTSLFYLLSLSLFLSNGLAEWEKKVKSIQRNWRAKQPPHSSHSEQICINNIQY